MGQPAFRPDGQLARRELLSRRGCRVTSGVALRSFAILSLVLCLSTGLLTASPAHAQEAHAKPNRESVDIDIDNLFQHWVHSSEEEPSGDVVRIYRPAASRNFPPSRFRMAYKFAPGGDCEFYFLSPDDNHRFRACRWSINASDETIIRIVANGTTVSFGIVELSGKILRLRPLE